MTATIEILGKTSGVTMYRVTGLSIDTLRTGGVSNVIEREDGSISVSASKNASRRLEDLVTRANAAPKPAATASSAERIVVEAGRYAVGDIVRGHTITGLGRPWTANADSASAYGIDPAASQIQYAYFN